MHEDRKDEQGVQDLHDGHNSSWSEYQDVLPTNMTEMVIRT